LCVDFNSSPPSRARLPKNELDRSHDIEFYGFDGITPPSQAGHVELAGAEVKSGFIPVQAPASFNHIMSYKDFWSSGGKRFGIPSSIG
jgi:hypothetical protein